VAGAAMARVDRDEDEDEAERPECKSSEPEEERRPAESSDPDEGRRTRLNDSERDEGGSCSSSKGEAGGEKKGGEND
jgi:hypothetical protein